MDRIPDWAWKAVTSFIIPIAMWALASHVTIEQHELRISGVEERVQLNGKELEQHEATISSTQTDIEILKVRIDYVANGIDDIKEILNKKEGERK